MIDPKILDPIKYIAEYFGVSIEIVRALLSMLLYVLTFTSIYISFNSRVFASLIALTPISICVMFLWIFPLYYLVIYFVISIIISFGNALFPKRLSYKEYIESIEKELLDSLNFKGEYENPSSKDR